jgi:hypothetical protein
VRAKDGGILILFGNDQPESLLHQGPKSPAPSAYGSTIPLSNPTSIRNPKPNTQPQRNTLTLKKQNKFRFEFDEPSHGSLLQTKLYPPYPAASPVSIRHPEVRFFPHYSFISTSKADMKRHTE